MGDDLPSSHNITIFCPRTGDKTTKWIMELIKKQNDLDTENWRLISRNDHKLSFRFRDISVCGLKKTKTIKSGPKQVETPRNPPVSSEKEKPNKLSESSEDLADDEDLDATIIEMGDQTPLSSQELGMELDLLSKEESIPVDGDLGIAQVNIHRANAASAVLARMFTKQHLGLALVQEPWYNQGIKGLHVKNAKVIWDQRASSPRACILACRIINYYILTEFLTRDCVPIVVEDVGAAKKTVVASVYFAGDEACQPPEITALAEYCKRTHSPIIIGCDANAHHVIWGQQRRKSKSLFDKDHREWDSHLPEIEVAIQNIPHLATGEAPFFSVFGHHMFLNGSSYKLASII
ncbi:GM19283 [Drosophila sechellia]|uniref:GM19283 n=1 Tax=Drosophila sechellia TaxID=7238 RepID=B4ILU5_DROSE|nr:GM19283 [Drosophila sechellia]